MHPVQKLNRWRHQVEEATKKRTGAQFSEDFLVMKHAFLGGPYKQEDDIDIEVK